MRRCRPLLGTFVEIECDCDGAIDRGFAAIQMVHDLMSAHELASDVSRINRFGHLEPVDVHPWTARVIERALFWSKQSEGAFDVLRAGKAALDRGTLARHADQPQPTAAHWTWLQIQGLSVRLMKPACVDLGGIAKGFAVDRAVEALRNAGCGSGLVNAGGDMRAFGPRSETIFILEPGTRKPLATCELFDGALATSAGLESEGALSFDHLVDVRPEWTSVTVSGPNACDADALTKVVWKLGQRARGLLAAVDAKAFAISVDRLIEPIGQEVLAA